MFKLKLKQRNIPDQELIDDVKQVASDLGQNSVTIEKYNEYGKFYSTTLTRRFGSWHKVLEKCDLSQNRTRMNIPEQELFENLASIWEKLGKQPTYSCLSEAGSKYSSGTYEYRFGSWNKALTAFIDYLNGNEIELPEKTADKIKKNRKTHRNINKRLRFKILIRDNCICKMCGASPAKNPDVVLHVDHIIPYSKGGETVEKNLRTLCHVCNIGKSDMVISNVKI